VSELEIEVDAGVKVAGGEMSPITAHGSHFSNSAELLGLRDEIFPTAEIESLFKFNHQSHLQNSLTHIFIIPMKTVQMIYRKPPLILLSFSVSEFKKLSLTSSATVLFSNAKFDGRSKSYAAKLFNPGNRGTLAHPSVAQAFRPFLSLPTPSPVSRPRWPHPPTRRGELAARARLFRGFPRSPARPATRRPLREAAVTKPSTPSWLQGATSLS
jgi:hypothetical protein